MKLVIEFKSKLSIYFSFKDANKYRMLKATPRVWSKF